MSKQREAIKEAISFIKWEVPVTNRSLAVLKKLYAAEAPDDRT